MKNMINWILLILRYILFLVGFSFTLYIVVAMYKRLDKDISNSINIFLPYFLLLVIYFINIIFRQKRVNKNIFYNLTCCLVFITNIVVGLRAIYDTNMVMNKIMGFNINFIYFSDYIIFMKILIYGLSISNILLMLSFEKNYDIVVNKNKDIEVL